MIRINQWSGLVTYASPFLIPPGATVEQTNMVNLLPGQIGVRGGMQKVGHVGKAVLELYGYSIGADRDDKIFVFTSSGTVEVVEAPNV